MNLPLPSPEGWISIRAQKGFWSEELGPSSFHLLPSHIVCYSATSLSQEVPLTLVRVAAKFLIFKTEKKVLPETKTLHAKRSSPSLSCTVANWGGGLGLLLLSFFAGQHWGIMLSSRIRRGYLKSPISFCLQCAGRLPSPVFPNQSDSSGC